MEDSQAQRISVYNGVSNRPRGWKTWKPQRASTSESPNPTVVKWNGTSRSSEVWDSLRRDPELWFRDGDCNVYLHSEGQSRRGAAFRVSYSILLESKFQPLISTFISRTRADTSTRPENTVLGPIDLFIPAPSGSTKRVSYSYHIATRNLFAFIFQKSIVGECLGSALITLMEGLYRLRTPGADNAQDLISYLDGVGYLNFNGQPTYALAILRLADVFQLRELYIDAFAHCCGMGGQIFLDPAYQLLSPVTRGLIRRVRREMHSRLGGASTKLKTFLNDEVKEIDDSLYPRAREHLQLFKTFLERYYTDSFGQYPPPSIDSQAMVFSADVFRTCRNDFEALYELLADGSFKAYQSSELLGEDRLCILQSIRSFDTRHNYESLLHPIPLVPDIARKKPAPFWRMSWPTRTAHLRPVDILGFLSNATNRTRSDVLENGLVTAYQQFEEDQITFRSNDNLENEDRVEGRKIRWILIYAIYQTLLQATKVPLEIKDPTGVPYHLCISTADVPPWEEKQSPHTQFGRSTPLSPCSSLSMPETRSHSRRNQATSNVAERPRSTIPNWSDANDELETAASRNSPAVERASTFTTRRPRSGTPEDTFRKHVVCEGSNREDSVVESKSKDAARTPRATPAKSLTDTVSDSSGSVLSSSSFRCSTSEPKTSCTSDTFAGNEEQIRLPIKEPEDEPSDSNGAICGLHSVKTDTTPSTSRWPKPLRVEALTEYVKRQTSGRFSPTLSSGRPLSAQERIRRDEPNTPRAKGKSTSDLLGNPRVSWPLGRPD
ncbi:hypothetical protein F5Y08DRAFT_263596 [Xylaria arbuscula]|nr:hypothetical protein F5Y08DRAFT_263596 [Xylaria arbuscula]